MSLPDGIKEFLFNDRNEFRAKYFDKHAPHSTRYWTFKVALNLLLQRGGINILETGCVRMKDDWGAGMSTPMFCDFAQKYGYKVVSIDNDETNSKFCVEMLKEMGLDSVHTMVVDDSIAAFKKLASNTANHGSIDLLYLDSYDFPLGDLLNIYGGQQDLNVALKTLADMTTDEIVAKHKDIINPSQDHAQRELINAMPLLHSGSIILIDDNALSGMGKPRLAKEWMAAQPEKFELILEDYQTLWTVK